MTTSSWKQPPGTFEQDEEAVYVLFAASQLAERANSPIDVGFLLAGLYVVAFNRLLPYLGSSESVRSFVAREYGLTLPIWVYWSQLLVQVDSNNVFAMHKLDAEASELLTQAGWYASQQHRRISILDFCRAIKDSDLRPCKNFIASGVDVERLLRDGAHAE